MQPLPLSLCVFDSTKGHFDRFDIYQRTIQSLASLVPLQVFARRYVHIKTDPDRAAEASRLGDMIFFYESHGFQVISSSGRWQHFSSSHQAEYCRDLVRMYSQVVDQRVPYNLHLESDWLFYPRNKSLIDHLETGLRYLDSHPTVLDLRIPRYQNEVARLQSVRAKHGLDVDVARDDSFSPSFYRHSDNHSHNPNIARTRDLYVATRLLDIEFARFSFHSEMGFTQCLKWLSPDHLPYSIYDPESVNVLHIGTKPGEEDKVPPTWVS